MVPHNPNQQPHRSPEVLQVSQAGEPQRCTAHLSVTYQASAQGEAKGMMPMAASLFTAFGSGAHSSLQPQMCPLGLPSSMLSPEQGARKGESDRQAQIPSWDLAGLASARCPLPRLHLRLDPAQGGGRWALTSLSMSCCPPTWQPRFPVCTHPLASSRCRQVTVVCWRRQWRPWQERTLPAFPGTEPQGAASAPRHNSPGSAPKNTLSSTPLLSNVRLPPVRLKLATSVPLAILTCTAHHVQS